MITLQEIRSLILLMSDNDPVVTEAVSTKILSLDDDEIRLMKTIINSDFSEFEMEYLNAALMEGEEARAEEEVLNYLRSVDPTLSKGAYLVTRLADHSADNIFFERTLRMLSDEISSEISDNMTEVEKVEIFNHILFKRMGFRYSVTGLKPEKETTLLNMVLELRQANYISIAIIYFMIAREVGLPVYPLWAQKGFFPVYLGPDNKMLFYLNMAYNFEILPREAIRDFIDEMESTYGDDALVVEKDLLLLSIYTQVLSDLYSREGDHKKVMRLDRILEAMGGRKSFGEY